jgi:hypothetical protein
MKLAAASCVALLLALPVYGASHVMSTEDAINNHIQNFGSGNLDALVADYSEDAVFITPMGVASGHDELRGLIGGFLAEFGKPGMSFTIDKVTASGDVGQVVWHGETADNVYNFATETYVVVDGKIVGQTFAASMTAK